MAWHSSGATNEELVNNLWGKEDMNRRLLL